MKCPVCRIHKLKSVKLNSMLKAMHCNCCKGNLIKIDNIRKWLQSRQSSEVKSDSESQLLEYRDTNTIVICSECHRMMTKYGISANTSHKLDSCHHCQTIWLDAGEWELLEQVGLQDNLLKIFSDAWQSKILDTYRKTMEDSRYKQLFGTSDYSTIKELKSWIASHPKKREIMNYLSKRNSRWGADKYS